MVSPPAARAATDAARPSLLFHERLLRMTTTTTNGRDLLLRSIRNETTPRPAWVPFVGCHGASLIGRKASDYLRSADLLVQGLKAADEQYRPDGLPVIFDLQMEAEVLGCELKWNDQGPPSVATHPLEMGRSLPDLPVFNAALGRFPVALHALRTLKKDIGGRVALYGLICGPFTLSLHLLGNSIFMQMFDHPDYVKAVVGFCASVGKKAAQAYLENGADMVAVVDPMTSQISPAHFREFCTPSLNDLFHFIRERKGLSSLFVCGDASRNLEEMGATACDNMSIDENIPLEKVRDITRACNKSFGGNLKLTSVLLLGTEDDAKLDAIRCIDVGGGCGYVLSPGCDLPFGVPPRNLAAVAAMVHDSYGREVAKRTIIARSAAGADTLKLPDYGRDPNVIIDVITLDSASCAPCQYMMDAVHRAAKRLAFPVVVTEHRITTREGIAMMSRLQVSNLPTICIDGKAVFISLIPDQDTLVKAIEERKAAKTHS
jgi:MtaA/CmuA family methyltransferase